MKQKLGILTAGVLIGIFVMALLRIHDDHDHAVQTSVIAAAEKLFGLEFTPAHRDSMLTGVRNNLQGYKTLREHPVPNDLWPSLQFNPIPRGFEPPARQHETNFNLPENVSLPENLDQLAFFTVAELSVLIKDRQVSSVELTQLFLERIRKYDSELESVITLTETLALKQAERADSLLDAGVWLGPLHGIPYGTKDLLALEGYPTTWGATPYKDQVIEETATVIKRLEDAGAVHLAKLTLGALAWGDIWFDGKTRSPWNTEIGASGSSAGSAAATASGLVPFAIGSETLGSIVSPATRNGVTGLRPTYGRVSRHGAMALSWSMDKIGPLTRSGEDAAIVFDAIYGPDGKDPSVFDYPFGFSDSVDFSSLRIGYHASAFEQSYPNQATDLETLNVLRELGAELIEIEMPQVDFNAMDLILSVEAAAAFDELTRSGRDSLMVRQVVQSWPNVFRTARFVPAVEYIQANRVRTRLIDKMHEAVSEVDVWVNPSFVGGNLLLTNLTGHPAVVVPNGFIDDMPVSITFTGHLFDEATVLALAHAYQQATRHHREIPDGFLN